MKRRDLGLAALAALVLSSCKKPKRTPPVVLGAETPRTEIFVLVDLSQTWHDPNDEAKQRADEQLLGEIGQGIALAAETLPQPIMAQYRIIGLNSLDRPPACNVVYLQTLAAVRKNDPARITQPRKLRDYLGVDCPRILLGAPAEPDTEISAALASVALRAPAPGAKRYMILASDLREESKAHEPIQPHSFDNTRVLVLYRPADNEDRQSGGAMEARVATWTSSLKGFGAEVQALPDSGFGRADVVRFLTSD